jgi:hypothetical protein
VAFLAGDCAAAGSAHHSPDRPEAPQVSSLDETERLAHEALEQLRRDYERLAAPYIEILCRVHSMRQPAIYISLDQLQQLQVEIKDIGKP